MVVNTAGILAFAIIALLTFVVIVRSEQVRTLKNSLDKMMRSFNDLDEQAKLIVKTDLALHKAQQELDKRLAAINALQKTSSLISTTLDVREIFRRLEKSLVSELGFEKSLLLMYGDGKRLQCRAASGFSKDTVERIMATIPKEQILMAVLHEGRALSSLSATKQRKERAVQIFGLEYFIISPVLTQDGVIGVLFVGNHSNREAITEGDEELVSILSNQIGQSLDNAQLFEQVYKSRQELESKIQERTKELASVLENVKNISKAKTEFVSAVSHELRTPLTSIKGYASILMAGKLGDIPLQVKERLEKINTHSDNLVKLINDLLDISRIESGRVEMKLKKRPVAPIIENTRDLLMPQMKEKNIQFVVDAGSPLPELSIDDSQIERVFINLISNAIKFTPKDGIITVRAIAHKDHVLFEVSDTGIGIAENDIPKLFEEFYRVENEVNQNVKGTGLGLTLARNIIEAHRGKLWLTSKINTGTTFYFTLPLSI